MGYTVDGEYTLELVSEPRAYEYIAQRIFCSGFILASRLNEAALEAILTGWQEIDEVTARRVRFLFFIDNQTTLTGYPEHPYFTENGFLRNNPDLRKKADAARFKIGVHAGCQVSRDMYGRPSRPWHPQGRVRRLAQELGIVRLRP